MKKVMKNLYVHKSNVDELYQAISKDEANAIKTAIENNSKWNFEIVKYSIDTKKISLIQSPNWNSANEPTVGDSLIIANGNTKIIKAKKREQIYHHKWEFVSKDYSYFDVEKSKQRSKLWKEKIPSEHNSKIGYRDYWNNLLEEYGIEK